MNMGEMRFMKKARVGVHENCLTLWLDSLTIDNTNIDDVQHDIELFRKMLRGRID
jgi:hypothetical protein